jgi:hypothetical protein
VSRHSRNLCDAGSAATSMDVVSAGSAAERPPLDRGAPNNLSSVPEGLARYEIARLPGGRAPGMTGAAARSCAVPWAATPVVHLRILVTRPEPTVRPPSRIANLRPSSIAIGWIISTRISVLSPGMTISVPSGRCTTPVTSVVRK